MRAAIAGSSASAAAIAVSIAVRQRIPSARRGEPDLGGVADDAGAWRRGVDDEAYPAVGDRLEDPDLADRQVRRGAQLRDRDHAEAGLAQERPRPGRGGEPVAGKAQRPGERDEPGLVAVGDAEERDRLRAGVCTGVDARRHERRADERLRERDPRVGVDPDDLAGRLHPRPDRRVDAAQLGRRERRRLDRDERRRLEQAVRPAQRLERLAERDPDRQLDHRDAGDLAHERHGPRGAGVDLDQVHAVVADDELGVDEPGRAERETDPLHRRHDQRLVALADVLRREDRDRVAAVDAGLLDVLEESRDQDPLAVADRVDVDLDALEVAVDPDRPIRVDDGRRRELPDEVLGRVAEVDREAADDEAGPDDDRVADPLGERECLVEAVGHAALGLGDAEPVEQRREAGPLLGLVDRLEVAAEQRDTAGHQLRGEVERRLAAERDDRGERRLAVPRLGLDDAPDALGVERLEVEPGARVEVGRDGFRVRVDHHRLPAALAERLGGAHRAVVELDPLPDPDRPRADDEGGGPADRRRLGLRARRGVRRVEVRRLGGELRRARVDHRVAGPEAERHAGVAKVLLPDPGERGELPVAEARPLRGREQRCRLAVRLVAGPRERLARRPDLRLEGDVPAHLGEEPRRDAGRLLDRLLGDAAAEQAEEPPEARVGRPEELREDDRRGGSLGVAGRLAGRAGLVDPADRLVGGVLVLVGVRAAAVDRGEVVEARRPARVLGERPGAGLLEAAERLVQGRSERPVDRHHLAGRLHLAAERPVGGRELVEREARQLDDDVVEGRLERGHGRAGDDVGDLGEPPPDGDLGGDASDRVAGRLAREGRAAADPRVDLDDRVLGRVRRERELDVAAALDAERPDDRERRAPEPLVDRVRAASGRARRRSSRRCGRRAGRRSPSSRPRCTCRRRRASPRTRSPASRRGTSRP